MLLQHGIVHSLPSCFAFMYSRSSVREVCPTEPSNERVPPVSSESTRLVLRQMLELPIGFGGDVTHVHARDQPPAALAFQGVHTCLIMAHEVPHPPREVNCLCKGQRLGGIFGVHTMSSTHVNATRTNAPLVKKKTAVGCVQLAGANKPILVLPLVTHGKEVGPAIVKLLI